jgi:dihydroflavonol-4-reductase
MRRVNVTGTQHVLEEAWKSGARRIIHCGTVGALGSSGPPGHVGDENHVHCGKFPSLYVKTKYEGVQLARELIRQGAPLIIVLPQAAYGPGTVKLTGRQIWNIKTSRMTAIPDAPMIFGYVHVDDVAEGMWLAVQTGRVGETYILGGQLMTLADFYQTVARHVGVRAPARRISPRVLRLLSWIREHIPGARRLFGSNPLSREEVAMSTEANFAYYSDKAARELGWKARTLDEGLPETIRWINDNETLFSA